MTLQLTLKKQWFDLIKSGEKTEEYRIVKPYWIKRLMDDNYPTEHKGDEKLIPHNMLFDRNNGHLWRDIFKAYHHTFRLFDTTHFTNGYSRNAPSLTIECKGISIGKGKPEWGAPDEDVFIISLGKIIEG